MKFRRVIFAVAVSLIGATGTTAQAATVDEALNCTRPLQCVYFETLFNTDPAFKSAVVSAFDNAKRTPPAWLGRGASTPMRPLLLRGKWYLLGTVADPQSARHQVMALFSAETKTASVLYVDPRGSNNALGTGDAESWRVLELASKTDSAFAQMINADDAPLPIALDGMMR